MFHGVVRYSGGADLFTETFVLYDQYGDIVYEKSDIPLQTFFISNTGSVFALNEYHLYLYQQDGSETMLRELVYPNGFGFSPDGALFFASDREGIFAYSHDGMLSSAYRPGRLFASTERGSWVAVISADTLFVYEYGSLGDTEFLPSPYARDVSFSTDGDNIQVRFPAGYDVYDTRNRTWVRRE
ncbi:MAG: hypothetical protein JSV98_02510 [candidate division WOR-3 bacterium]|nr:MAG: hypothetical protein JSV98_02510 [candidate division WOR-3 bacterium]